VTKVKVTDSLRNPRRSLVAPRPVIPQKDNHGSTPKRSGVIKKAQQQVRQLEQQPKKETRAQGRNQKNGKRKAQEQPQGELVGNPPKAQSKGAPKQERKQMSPGGGQVPNAPEKAKAKVKGNGKGKPELRFRVFREAGAHIGAEQFHFMTQPTRSIQFINPGRKLLRMRDSAQTVQFKRFIL
jgi:hypothetical protein